MKYSLFLVKITLALACAGWILSSCEKNPEMSFSSRNVILDASDESQAIDISANVSWTATVSPAVEWLNIRPTQGKGNITITLAPTENEAYTDRTVFVVFSGDGGKTDSIRVIQTAAIDVAEVIEDEIFRQYCLGVFDNSPKDGKLSLKETKNAVKINVRGSNITSLAGIEHFTNITELNCSGNDIESIELGKNKELKKLDCSYNPIGRINVGELVKLTELFVDATELQTIDVSNNTKLYWLSVSNNQLSSIDLGNNTELEVLECNVNHLANLDLRKNTKLSFLYCNDNQLSTLELSSNKALERIWCNNNLLANLDVTQNTALQRLSCAKNSIASLNLSNNTQLIQLMCDQNRLTTLNLTNNLKLTDLRCTSNLLTNEIDISKNYLLEFLYLQNNPNLKLFWVWSSFETDKAKYKEKYKYDTYEWDTTADFRVK